MASASACWAARSWCEEANSRTHAGACSIGRATRSSLHEVPSLPQPRTAVRSNCGADSVPDAMLGGRDGAGAARPRSPRLAGQGPIARMSTMTSSPGSAYHFRPSCRRRQVSVVTPPGNRFQALLAGRGLTFCGKRGGHSGRHPRQTGRLRQLSAIVGERVWWRPCTASTPSRPARL